MKKPLKIPFGEFKGYDIDDPRVPRRLLCWIATHYRDDSIATAADKEYQWRLKNNVEDE
jgi:hypothetical protein